MSTLVFDLGMHNGDDTAFYLARGHRVVAVEANPALCEAAHVRFTNQIAAGELVIVNRAIADTADDVAFHISCANDQWSSTDPRWAGRENASTRVVTVPGVSLARLIDEFGVPHYIKIDIEGADLLAMEQLAVSSARPDFVSVEDCRFGYEYVETLSQAGFGRFQLVDQSTLRGQRDPMTGMVFSDSSSGPFGDDLPDHWLGKDDFLRHYEDLVRARTDRLKYARHGNTVWWDIHARR